MNGKRAEVVNKIHELQRVFSELGYLVGDANFSDAVDDVFNNADSCDSYPFAESFEELAFRVGSWEVK